MNYKCPKCGNIIEEGVSPCPTCGQVFKWPEKKVEEVKAEEPALEAKVEEKQTFCGQCGAEVPTGSKFCNSCGTPVVGTPVENMPVVNTPVINTPAQVTNVEPVTTVNTASNETKKSKNRMPILIAALVAVVIIAVCAFVIPGMNKATLPNVNGTDVDTAKTMLASSGFTPVVEEVYDDTVENGNVIYSSPSGGQKITKNSVVTLYVSKGPRYIGSADSTIHWYFVGNGEDDWHFESPYIEEDKLYIKCNATFKTGFIFKKGGFGNASISDTFDKYVPIEVEVSKTEVKSGNSVDITFIIPLADLDVKKPTSIYTRTSIIVNGVEEDLRVNFSMSW